MKELIWKFRYARHMYSRIGGERWLAGSFWSDWSFCWSSAVVSWEDLDGPNHDPIDSADEELSNWTE